jgi:hypothetical protein
MHMFGLAIDVNYQHNPYLLASKSMPNDIFERVGRLMKGDKLGKGQKTDYAVGMYTDIGAQYKRVSEFNQMLLDYFALAQPAGDKELNDKLRHATGEWKKLDAGAARAQIEKDVRALAGRLHRKDFETIRSQGYMNLKEDLVRGLRLNWGSWYGDMMHFDMRTDGSIGQWISEAKDAYLAEVAAKARAPAPPAP